MDCEDVSYEFKNDSIAYIYRDLEHILALNIFMWFSMDYGYLGIYEKKNINVDMKINKNGFIELVFNDDKGSCCYKGFCENASELFECIESFCDLWGFSGLF